MVFRNRDMLVRQRTQTINALRAHLAEHGVVAPAGAVNVKRLADRVEDDSAPLPDLVWEMARRYLEQIEALTSRINDLEARLRERGSGPLADHARYRADHGRRHRELRAGPAHVQVRPGFLGMARSRTAAAFDGRQTPPGTRVENGTT
jgi:transposase